MVVAACTSTSSSPATGATSTANPTGPITVGAALSLTGGFQADGVAFQKGYQLWADDVNAHGGIGGRKVKLVILDDKSSLTQVVADYQKLLGTDHVDLAFGPFSSALTGPAALVAARFGMAMLEGAGGAPSIFDSPSNQAAHNVFDVSLPIAESLVPLVQWIAALPANEQPKSAAYAMAQDPFALPPVQLAQTLLSNVVPTAYSQIFTPGSEKTDKAQADAVIASGAQLVMLGSPDVPTVTDFMKEFRLRHFRPKVFIAAAGPDQGSAFTDAVGVGNANGMMVPNGWYPGYANPESERIVSEYVKKYGGTADGVNADVAEAYSVGQVAAGAVLATGGTDNAKIISWLHSGVHLDTVQGTVEFDPLGENGAAAAFIFQWQNGKFDQVLPTTAKGSVPITAAKPDWVY